MTMAHVVKTTVLLADIAEFGQMNQVYATFFGSPFPPEPPSRQPPCPRAQGLKSKPLPLSERRDLNVCKF